ncbi:DUF72 domain-containing protein [Leptolyngbya cf. ectocarpi LEGE 11479]|uniref:DUF72 domain-containing protein n=1 Tax=Leptolyngbya cf. ectocarpi LEGE 11479 TaxID=1828722 RepID=A0A928ZWU8_LEPEC|nr:DUF72 domain-containing protein [Leptolyngbya ectocarpi]MBE9068905.1 DUF72 domain-containing protein [Leptolyngbya cf. ectocarpi LEGE 11479]
MTADFRLGCAVWAYKSWLGNFYPAESRATNFLRLYGERLTCVEGNTTFYSIPSPEMVQRWADNTPDTFRFCPKLPRTVTHGGALMPQLSDALSFLSLMQGLGPRLGPIFAQLPPRYSPASFADLEKFVAGWPHTTNPLAVEVRHLDWFRSPQSERLNSLLAPFNVGRVLLDTRPVFTWSDAVDDPQLRSERKKPRVPLLPVTTANFVLVRYISHPDLDRNRDFLAGWVERVGEWLAQGLSVCFFVHCPKEAQSPAIARYFQEQLEKAGIDVPPLPWSSIQAEPQQLGLF